MRLGRYEQAVKKKATESVLLWSTRFVYEMGLGEMWAGRLMRKEVVLGGHD